MATIRMVSVVLRQVCGERAHKKGRARLILLAGLWPNLGRPASLSTVSAVLQGVAPKVHCGQRNPSELKRKREKREEKKAGIPLKRNSL